MMFSSKRTSVAGIGDYLSTNASLRTLILKVATILWSRFINLDHFSQDIHFKEAGAIELGSAFRFNNTLTELNVKVNEWPFAWTNH